MGSLEKKVGHAHSSRPSPSRDLLASILSTFSGHTFLSALFDHLAALWLTFGGFGQFSLDLRFHLSSILVDFYTLVASLSEARFRIVFKCIFMDSSTPVTSKTMILL